MHTSLCIVKGLLVHVSSTLTSSVFVVSKSHREVMLMYAHASPYAIHKGTKAAYNALQQGAYWPQMQKDVTDHIKVCLVCCQF